MDVLLFVLGVALAALGIGASIALHEIGHLVPAKRFGVKVTQYMVGFGPTLWSRARGETEYGVKWIPLGGYIRMVGLYPPPHGAPEGSYRPGTTGRFAVLAEEARQQAWEEVETGDENRLFFRLSVPKKVTVMMGGPLMNLLIATFTCTVLLCAIGLPTASTQLREVVSCIPPAVSSQAAAEAALSGSAGASGECTTGDPVSPAKAAGLVAGDTIVAVDGVETTKWSDVTAKTRPHPGTTVTLTVRDGSGTERAVPVTIATAWGQALDADGQPTGDVTQVGYLGIMAAIHYVPQPISAVPGQMWDLSVASAKSLVGFPVRVAQLAGDLATGEARDPNSPVSVVGVGRISGEVAAADEPVKAKATLLLSLLASLNLFLFLFNLIPLLPLDGGHVAGALWEGLRRQLARLRGLADPEPVDMARMLPVTYVVVMVLVAMSAVVILADIVNPIRLFG